MNTYLYLKVRMSAPTRNESSKFYIIMYRILVPFYETLFNVHTDAVETHFRTQRDKATRTAKGLEGHQKRGVKGTTF